MAERSSNERWLARVRLMPPAPRIAAIERKLKALPKTPTTANVYFRKALLRLLDASRLEAGLVSADDLQRENSPFAANDFRLMLNPLAKVPHVETRGKQVRPCRAFTEDELQRLFAIAGRRRLAYQMLLYTGQRKSEVRALLWSDLHLDEAKPYALFRESTTKDKDKRAVPLRPEIVEQLEALRPKPDEAHSLRKPVFWFRWPTYDLLRGDLKRAGIERVDALGRSVHFHSFRKTWQTLGVRYGINQRVAQEVLGHSDANLTAKVYTDVPALALHTEIAKLPWIEAKPASAGAVTPASSPVAPPDSGTLATPDAHKNQIYQPADAHNAQRDAQTFVRSGHPAALADLCDQFVASVNVTDNEGFSRVLSSLVTSWQKDEMAARAGIEPATK